MSGYERIRLGRMIEKIERYEEYARRLGLLDTSSYVRSDEDGDELLEHVPHEKMPLI